MAVINHMDVGIPASPTTNPAPSPSRSGFGAPGDIPFADVLGMRLGLLDVKAPGYGVVVLSYRPGWIWSTPGRGVPDGWTRCWPGCRASRPEVLRCVAAAPRVVTPATIPDHALGVVWWPPASMICERKGHG